LEKGFGNYENDAAGRKLISRFTRGWDDPSSPIWRTGAKNRAWARLKSLRTLSGYPWHNWFRVCSRVGFFSSASNQKLNSGIKSLPSVKFLAWSIWALAPLLFENSRQASLTPGAGDRIFLPLPDSLLE